MDKGFSQDSSSQDMTKLQNNHSPDNTSIATVTTAEVSSAETTESPRQQPQAVTMATDIPSVSYSTVHVQQSQAISRTLLLSKASSESLTHNPRKTLVRSEAVRSTPSPPLPSDEVSEGSMPQAVMNTSFDSYMYQTSDNEVMRESTPRQESIGRNSKQGSFSRDNSFEYTDSTGTDLHEFIVKTLRNPRDRKFVLKLEHDFLNFIQDPMIIFIKYPPMTSYYRMIVHRVAAFFGMEHNVDQQTGKSVIINRSINTRIPDQRFADLVSLSREESEDSEGPMPREILRRQNTPSGDSTPPKVDSPLISSLGMEDKRSKSIEERVEEYQKARERIFNQDSFSSQSSQSSKGDSDMPHPQILTRDDAEFIAQEHQKEPTTRIYKSQSFDNERTMDKRSASGSGIRIMSNKMFTRSSSSPGGSAAAFAAAERLSKGSGSPKGSRLPLTGYGMPVSGVQYWTPEGIPMVPVQGSEVQMVQAQGMPAGMQGMVPVMTGGGAASQGNVMWSVPSDSLQQGMMLINPNTGTPALGPDGNPMVIVQPTYQHMVMKPGSNQGYTQQPQQHRPQQQQQPMTPVPQAATISPQGGQVVMPQYVGVQQPLYVVQQPNRSHFGQQQGTESLTQAQWAGTAQPMTSPSYRDLGNQFSTMSVSGQPQEVDQTMQQGMMAGGDSGVVASSTTTPPLYVASASQASRSGQPGQVQYMMMPHQGMHPHQPLRSMVGQPVPSHMVPQAIQQGTSPQQSQAFVVAAQPPFSPSTYPPNYGFSKDGAMLQHQRSQSPPSPPRTSSPVLAAPYNQQSIAVNSLGNQHVQNTQYQSTAHSQSQVLRPMVPLVVAGTHPVQVGAPVIPGSQPGQIQAQGSTIHYQQHVVQVPAPFHPHGQNRAYNLDRRPPKSSDLYTPESAMMAGQGGPGVAQVAGSQYGEPIGMVPGERGHYTHYYQPQRFTPTQGGSGQGAQHQQYTKHKSKQYHKKKDSPREQSSLKKQGSKSSDTESSAGAGTVLEIYDMIGGVKDHEADVFDELVSKGAKIKRPSDNSHDSGETLRVVFSSAADAEQALAQINSPNFKLRYPGCASTVDSNSQVQSNP